MRALNERFHGCRWARLDAPPGAPAADAAVHKAAVNVGRRPTMDAAGADITVEAHLLHAFAGDFYGRRLRVVLCGCACCTLLVDVPY